MTNVTSLRTHLLRSVVAATALVAAAGCSSSSSPASPVDSGTDTGKAPGKDSGAKDATKDTGSKDSGTKDAGTTTDAGGDGGSTLYGRLGGHAGIRAAINAVVAQELMNADINSYFFFQGGAPGNGHPTADQIEECFTDLVGSAAGGPEQYPTTLGADAGSYVCRSMTAIHAPLLISGGTFDTFVMIAGAELSALGVSAADLTTLAGALEATKSSIVSAPLADAGAELYPGDGATTTLYERLGGHAGIQAAVKAIVGQELMNTDIASYFFFQAGAPGNGHPSATEIEECFTDLVGSASGGPETYPATVTADDGGVYTCRDLTAIHAPLLISGGTFDTFVMIAATELGSLGVSTADITTLGGALEATRGSIVTTSLNDAGVQPFPGDAGH
jgi:hypothetical protein